MPAPSWQCTFLCAALAASPLGGCHRGPGPLLPADAYRDVAARMAPAVVAPVGFDAPVLGGLFSAELDVPLVRVEVNGRDALFLLDTGSSDLVLSLSLARALELPLTSDAPGRDHHGNEVEARRTPRARLVVGGVAHDVRDLAVVDLSGGLSAAGIEGVLNPLRLWRSGTVVLDFPREQLLFFRENDAERVVRRAYPQAKRLVADIRVHEAQPLSKVEMLGHELTAQINTGASRSEILQRFTKKRAGATITTVAAGGKRDTGVVIDGATVRIGGASFGPLSIVARDRFGGQQAYEANVGMDLLRGLLVAVSRAPGRLVLAQRGRDANAIQPFR